MAPDLPSDLTYATTLRMQQGDLFASVGSVGDSYNNALAETIIALFKTEVIHHRGP